MKVKDHFLSKEVFEVVPDSVKGVLKTTPLPHDLSKYYDSKNYISHHQEEKTIRNQAYKAAQYFNINYKKNILRKLLRVQSAVLDYGCGAGEFLSHIKNDFNVLGYEPNETARKVTAEKIGHENIITNIEDIPNATLDAITLWHVLEHIDNQDFIISQFRKKLKANGLLIIAIPNYNSFDAQYYKEFWAAYDVPRHVYHFSPEGIRNIFNGNGWKVIQTKSLLLDSLYISIISEQYKKSRISWLKGGVVGLISNFKALKSGDFSSVIYIIRKTE